MQSHRDPDVVVPDQVEEVFELESVRCRRPELARLEPWQIFISGVSILGWHDVGLEELCEAEANLFVLGADVILGGILDLQLELEIVLGAQSRHEQELDRLLLLSILTVSLDFELVKLVVHD